MQQMPLSPISPHPVEASFMNVDRFAPVRRVVLAYALGAFLWVLLSDRAVESLFSDQAQRETAHLWKGWLFVLVTTVLLCWGLKRLYRRLLASTSEQLRTAAREAKTAALLQALAETSPDAIFAKDHEGRYLLFNREAERLLGKTREQVLGRDDHVLFPPEQVALLQANDRHAMTQGRALAYEERLVTCDGPRTFLTTKGPLRIGDEVTGTFGVSRDITEMVAVARERDQSLARLNEVISRVTDGFMAVNAEQYLTYVNHQAAAFIEPGTEPQSMVGRLVWDLIPGAVGTRYADAFFSAMADGRSALVEDWFEPWQRWIECRIYPSVGGASVYFTDISERKRAELALERSQKDLSALAASLMSQERETNRHIAQTLHDQLGQQLSSARLYLDVIQAAQAQGRPFAPDLLSKSLALLTGAIAEVRHVLLELRPPLLEEQGLVAALDNDLRNSPACALGVRLSLEIQPLLRDLRWPDTVEYAVFMITREAMANALQHAQARAVVVSLDGDASFLSLRVEDDGVGIAADAREGRSGHLGVVGMRERAQAVGGRLVVGPRDGGGTVVELTIEGLTT